MQKRSNVISKHTLNSAFEHKKNTNLLLFNCGVLVEWALSRVRYFWLQIQFVVWTERFPLVVFWFSQAAQICFKVSRYYYHILNHFLPERNHEVTWTGNTERTSLGSIRSLVIISSSDSIWKIQTTHKLYFQHIIIWFMKQRLNKFPEIK